MADRPRNDDWWLASDGKWYPPHLTPGDDTTERDLVGLPELSRRLTRTTTGAVLVASALLAVAAFFGVRVATDIRNGIGLSADVADATSNEIAFGGWSGFALLALAAAGVLVLMWVWAASKVVDARGATDRRWRGGWTIGAWFIPIANLILPKLVFNELEKGLQVPARSAPIGASWTAETRTQLADIWWLTWVTAVVGAQFASFFGGAEGATNDTVANGFMLAAFAMMVFAVSGVFLALVLSRLDTFSRR